MLFFVWGNSNSCPWIDYIWLGENELDKKSLWKDKRIRRLLLIAIVVDLQQLDQKRKLVMYTRVFVELYNWRSRRLVHETYEIVKLEKYTILRAENCLNFGGIQFYKIFEVLWSAYIISKNTKDNTFYLNNYIDWDQFN